MTSRSLLKIWRKDRKKLKIDSQEGRAGKGDRDVLKMLSKRKFLKVVNGIDAKTCSPGCALRLASHHHQGNRVAKIFRDDKDREDKGDVLKL